MHNRRAPALLFVLLMLAACAAPEAAPTVVIPTLAQLPTVTTATSVVQDVSQATAALPAEPLPTAVPTSSIGIRIDGLFQGSLQAANGDTVAQALVSFTQIGDELTGNFLFTDADGSMIEVEARGTVAGGGFSLGDSRVLVGEWALFSDTTCETTFNLTYMAESTTERISGTLIYSPACTDFAPTSSTRGALTIDLNKATGS